MSVVAMVMIFPLFAGEEQKMSPEEQKMMEKWQEYMTPGKFHKYFEQTVGTWDSDVTWWMKPGAPPTKSSGIAENKIILGGRYLYTTFKGESMGQPFEGIGIAGYDNFKKEFISVWLDSMGTGIFITQGKCDDPECKKYTYTGVIDDAVTGGKINIREVLTIVNEDKHVMEMFNTGSDGKEFKSMVIVYTRKK